MGFSKQGKKPARSPCTFSLNIGCFWLYVTNVTVTYVKPFFKRLNWNYIFEYFEDLHVWCQMKAYMYVKIKAKHTWKQSIQAYKNHPFADKVYIFSENGSK